LFFPGGRYDIGTSGREEKLGIPGYHGKYNLKDFLMENRDDPIPDNALMTFVDTDYYMSEEELSRWIFNRPAVLYTLQPHKIYHKNEESIVKFVSPNQIEECIIGGDQYRHTTHNFESTVMAIPEYPRPFTFAHYLCSQGIYRKWCVYSVDRVLQPGTTNRYFVFLNPRTVVRDVGRRFETRFATERWGSTLVTQCGDWLSMTVHSKGGALTRHVGNIHLKGQISLAEETHSALMIRQLTCAEPSGMLPRGDITNLLPPNSPPYMSAWLRAYLPNATGATRITSYAPVDGKHDYVYDIEDETPDSSDLKSDGMVVFPSPTSEGTFVPMSCEKNDKAAIKGRIQEVANKKVPPSVYGVYARDFLRMIVPDDECHKTAPLDLEQVNVLQNKPSQRQRNKRANNLEVISSALQSARAKTFQKRECYGKPTHPRIITNVTDVHNQVFSAYVRGAKPFLKRQPWYAAGLTPSETEESVHRFCEKVGTRLHEGIVATDYSRLDGTISMWIRENLEKAFLKRVFPEAHYKIIDELMLYETSVTTHSVYGVLSKPAGARLSGSPCTTDFNTLVNAFVAYCAWRLKTEKDTTITQRKKRKNISSIFSWIGPKCGDDGLEVSGLAGLMEEAASALGLKLKCEACNAKEYVPFCGRHYIQPMYECCSVVDIMRTLSHLHVSFGDRNLPTFELARRRVSGYLTTDPRTPYLSDYCRAVLRLVGKEQITAGELNEAFRQAHADEYYRIKGGPYSQPEHMASAIQDHIVSQLGITNRDFFQKLRAMEDAKSLTDLPIIKVSPRTAPARLLIDGDVFEKGEIVELTR
jgi:hypothetical protein